jgi:hypothetical protein
MDDEKESLKEMTDTSSIADVKDDGTKEESKPELPKPKGKPGQDHSKQFQNWNLISPAE